MKIISGILFYLLLWLRPVALFGGRIVGGFFTFGFLAGILVKWGLKRDVGVHTMEIFLMGGIGIGIFVFLEIYDVLLLKLNPTGNALFLTK